jgi:hypothetical protein
MAEKSRARHERDAILVQVDDGPAPPTPAAPGRVHCLQSTANLGAESRSMNDESRAKRARSGAVVPVISPALSEEDVREDFDTVGAVCVDARGSIACGESEVVA